MSPRPATPDQDSTLTARTLRAAATLVETKHQTAGKYQAGPDAYTEVHRAHAELYGRPALSAIERGLGLSQLQHWDAGSPEEVATELRRVADSLAGRTDADVTAEAHAARIQQIRNDLSTAIWGEGTEPPCNYEIGHLVDEIQELARAVGRVLGAVEAAERDRRDLTPAKVRNSLWRAVHIVPARDPRPEMHG